MNLKRFPTRKFNSIIEFSVALLLSSLETLAYLILPPQPTSTKDAHTKSSNKNKCVRQWHSRESEWFPNYLMHAEIILCLTSYKGLWKIMLDEILSMGGFAIKQSNEA